MNDDKSSTYTYTFMNEEIEKIKWDITEFEQSKVTLILGDVNTKDSELATPRKADFLKFVGCG